MWKKNLKISGVSDGRDFENVLNLLKCSGKSPFVVLLPSTAGITLKQSDNGGIVLCSLNKLLQRQFTCERHQS